MTMGSLLGAVVVVGVSDTTKDAEPPVIIGRSPRPPITLTPLDAPATAASAGAEVVADGEMESGSAPERLHSD